MENSTFSALLPLSPRSDQSRFSPLSIYVVQYGEFGIACSGHPLIPALAEGFTLAKDD